MTNWAGRELWLWGCLALLGIGLVVSSLQPIHGAMLRNVGYIRTNVASSGSEPHNGTLSEAVRSMEAAAELAPANYSVQRTLGFLYLATGDNAAAVDVWGRIPKLADELIAKGQAAEGAGQDDQAKVWYTYAATIAPEEPAGWLSLGLLLEKNEDWQGASQVYKAAMDTWSGSISINGDVPYRLALIKSRHGPPPDWKSIVELLNTGIAHDSFIHQWSRIQSHLLRGDALSQLDQKSEAKRDYAWVVEASPDNYWATIRLGRLIWELDHDPEQAEQYFLAASAIDPETKFAYRELGQLYAELGRTDMARSQFAQVLRIDPEDGIATEWFRQQEK